MLIGAVNRPAAFSLEKTRAAARIGAQGMPTDRGSRAFVSVASWSGRLVHVHEALSKGTAGVAGGDPPSADGAHRAAVRRSQIAGVPPHDRAANLPCTDQRLRLQLDPLALSGDGSAAAIGTAVEAGLSVLESGRSVALYTAMGPSADRGGELDSFKGARIGLAGRSAISRPNSFRAPAFPARWWPVATRPAMRSAKWAFPPSR